MTWSPNANLAALLASSKRDLIGFAVIFEDWSTVYTTMPITWPSYTTKKYLEMRDFEGAQIDSAKGSFTFGSCRFALIDKSDEVMGLLQDLDMRERIVTVYCGGKGVAQSDWEAIGVFQVTNISSNEYGRFEFSCIDPFRQFQRDLFVNLGDGASADIEPSEGPWGSEWYPPIGSKTIYVNSSDGEGFAVDDYVVIRYKTSTHYTTISAIKRGENRDKFTITDALTFRAKSGSTITKCARLQGNPVNILVRLLLADFATVGDIQTDFPLTVSGGALSSDPPDGLGIPSTLIDSTQIQAERDGYLSDANGEVIPLKKQSGRSYIEGFCWGLCSLIVTRSGKLGIKALRQPYSTSSTPTVTAAKSDVWQYDYSPSDFYNKVIVRGDEFDGEYSDLATVQDSDLVTAHGSREVTIESPWLRSSLTGAAQASALAGRLLPRVSIGSEKVIARGFLSLITVEQGDVVSLTHPSMPDRNSGSALSSVPGEVAQLSPQLGGKTVELTVMLYGGGRIGAITSDAQADYPSATTEEKAAYAFICQDDGTMSGGDPGYRIA